MGNRLLLKEGKRENFPRIEFGIQKPADERAWSIMEEKS